MFSFFKKNKSNISDRSLQLLTKLEESVNVSHGNTGVKLSDNEVWKEIQQEEEMVRREIALLVLAKLSGHDGREYALAPLRRKIFKSEVNAKKQLSQEFLQRIFQVLQSCKQTYDLPINDLLFSFSYYLEKFGQDDHLLQATNYFIKKADKDSWVDAKLRKMIVGIRQLYDSNNKPFPFADDDVAGIYLIEHWENAPNEFGKIIDFCWGEKYKSKPSKAWLKQADKLIKELHPAEKAEKLILNLFELVAKKGAQAVRALNANKEPEVYPNTFFVNRNPDKAYLKQENEDALCYLIWYCGLLSNAKINTAIRDLALSSLTKIKGVGSLSTRNGNAAMLAFTYMPEEVGIVNLLNIRNKTANKNIKKIATGHIGRKAEELGLTEEALLELAAPTFGMIGHEVKKDLGNYTGIIETGDVKKPTIRWLNNKTNAFQKSLPKEVKEQHAEELKSFKALLKDVTTALAVHTKRLEQTYINKIEWTIKNWKQYYVEHPFLSRYASLLIWFYDEKETAIQYGRQWINAKGEVIDPDLFSAVKLWHPIYSDQQTIADWRNFMMEKEIRQPFKQAFREIYKVTDAELNTATYSNRFAAHILYQYQFRALAKLRDWNYDLQGGFDSHNTPRRSIPAFNCRIEFWVEPVEDSLNDMNIYNYLASDQVRIYTGQELLRMEDVPAILFTEAMRDIDMFVGVCSIGNNPEWEDGGATRNYWQSYSFGELSTNAKTRKEVLQTLIPKLKIGPQCSFTDKFLIVKGNIRSYKIHFGSGNILMTPNDEYLCIVPNAKSQDKKIFLPFDDDRTLSIIISKAMLLADESKIKDTTILSQIKL